MRFHSSSHPPPITFLLFIAKFRCAHNALLPACLLQQCVSRMQPRSVSPSSASDHSLRSCCSCQRRFRPQGHLQSGAACMVCKSQRI
jgi:hypothetical protein